MTDPLPETPAARKLDFHEFWRCACAYNRACNPSRQRVARTLQVEPPECIVFPGMLTHVNPTSREDVCAPF